MSAVSDESSSILLNMLPYAVPISMCEISVCEEVILSNFG